MNMIIAILGLGEAGSLLARDLIAAGVSVRGRDPNPTTIPKDLFFAANNGEAVTGADLVLSVNWASMILFSNYRFKENELEFG